MARGRKKGVKVGPYKKKKIVVEIPKIEVQEVDVIDFSTVKIFNLTGHDIVLENGFIVKPLAKVRCDEKEYLLGWVEDIIPVFKSDIQKTILPPPNKNKIYIVSQIVAKVHDDRQDLFIPYKVGNNNCKGIQQNPFYKLPNKQG